jgi:hypothetical protein
MRWAVHVVSMGKRRGPHRGLVGKLRGKIPLGNPGVDGRIILKYSCECGNEPSGSI